MRAATAARLLLGGACVVVPGWMLGAVRSPDRDDGVVRTVARVLGARMVVQGCLDVAWGRRTRGIGMAVELTHAASMLPVAMISPLHRRAASVSAAVALGIAALDVVQRRGASTE